MKITFNTPARKERIATASAQCIEKIREYWETGISPVPLEADTDIFPEVRGLVLKEVENAGLGIVGPKSALSLKRKDKTLFTVVNKEVL